MLPRPLGWSLKVPARPPTPCKSTKSRLPDAKITKGRRSFHLFSWVYLRCVYTIIVECLNHYNIPLAFKSLSHMGVYHTVFIQYLSSWKDTEVSKGLYLRSSVLFWRGFKSRFQNQEIIIIIADLRCHSLLNFWKTLSLRLKLHYYSHSDTLGS